MVRFFLKLIFFCAVVGAPYLYFQQKLMAKNDAFYWKSTHKAGTLIIGGSRAFKGIAPHVLKNELAIQSEVLNLGFTAVLSPYGKEYFRLIKRKLDHISPEPHRFIVSVNPGVIMDFADEKTPRESSFAFYKMWFVNIHPNFEYIFRHPRDGQSLLVAMIYENTRPRFGRKIFHDGYAATFTSREVPSFRKIERERLLKYDLIHSPEREKYLLKTVTYLNQFGSVYLVRMPVSAEMLAEENACYSNFNATMQLLADKFKNVYYIDYSINNDSSGYKFTDGHHHLEGKSAIKFTKTLAQFIKENP